MSTGLPTEAWGDSRAAIRSRVGGASGSTRRPLAAQASVQTMPGPPTFVTTATLSPRGSG